MDLNELFTETQAAQRLAEGGGVGFTMPLPNSLFVGMLNLNESLGSEHIWRGISDPRDFARKLNAMIQALTGIVRPVDKEGAVIEKEMSILGSIMLKKSGFGALERKDLDRLFGLVHDFQSIQARRDEITTTVEQRRSDLEVQYNALSRRFHVAVEALNVEYEKLSYYTGRIKKEMRVASSAEQIRRPSPDRAAGLSTTIEVVREQIDPKIAPRNITMKMDYITTLMELISIFRKTGPPFEIMRDEITSHLYKHYKAYRKAGGPDKLQKDIEFLRYERKFLEKAKIEQLELGDHKLLKVLCEGYMTIKTRDMLFGVWLQCRTTISFTAEVSFKVEILKLKPVAVNVVKVDSNWLTNFLRGTWEAFKGLFGKEGLGVDPTELAPGRGGEKGPIPRYVYADTGKKGKK